VKFGGGVGDGDGDKIEESKGVETGPEVGNI
jgi:hypothetical protein